MEKSVGSIVAIQWIMVPLYIDLKRPFTAIHCAQRSSSFQMKRQKRMDRPKYYCYRSALVCFWMPWKAEMFWWLIGTQGVYSENLGETHQQLCSHLHVPPTSIRFLKRRNSLHKNLGNRHESKPAMWLLYSEQPATMYVVLQPPTNQYSWFLASSWCYKLFKTRKVGIVRYRKVERHNFVQSRFRLSDHSSIKPNLSLIFEMNDITIKVKGSPSI